MVLIQNHSHDASPYLARNKHMMQSSDIDRKIPLQIHDMISELKIIKSAKTRDTTSELKS